MINDKFSFMSAFVGYHVSVNVAALVYPSVLPNAQVGQEHSCFAFLGSDLGQEAR